MNLAYLNSIENHLCKRLIITESEVHKTEYKDSGVTVSETNKLTTYSTLVATIVFLIILIPFDFFIMTESPGFLPFFIFVNFIILIPLAATTLYHYRNNLWKKFSISDEKIEFSCPGSTNSIKWTDFDAISLRIRAPNNSFFTEWIWDYNNRSTVKFYIGFLRDGKKGAVKRFRFKYFDINKGSAVLTLIRDYTDKKNKKIKLKKKGSI